MLIFLMVGLAITFPMMLTPSAVGVIIGVIAGIGINFVLLSTTSIWIGGGAAIIWLIVAGAIILWKINKGGGQ
jgi:hypothetical protein